MAENSSNPFESSFFAFPFGIVWICLMLTTISIIFNFDAFELALEGEKLSGFEGWSLLVAVISLSILSIYFMWSSVAHSAKNEKWTWFALIIVLPGVSVGYFLANRLWEDQNWS